MRYVICPAIAGPDHRFNGTTGAGYANFQFAIAWISMDSDIGNSVGSLPQHIAESTRMLRLGRPPGIATVPNKPRNVENAGAR